MKNPKTAVNYPLSHRTSGTWSHPLHLLVHNTWQTKKHSEWNLGGISWSKHDICTIVLSAASHRSSKSNNETSLTLVRLLRAFLGDKRAFNSWRTGGNTELTSTVTRWRPALDGTYAPIEQDIFSCSENKLLNLGQQYPSIPFCHSPLRVFELLWSCALHTACLSHLTHVEVTASIQSKKGKTAIYIKVSFKPKKEKPRHWTVLQNWNSSLETLKQSVQDNNYNRYLRIIDRSPEAMASVLHIALNRNRSKWLRFTKDRTNNDMVFPYWSEDSTNLNRQLVLMVRQIQLTRVTCRPRTHIHYDSIAMIHLAHELTWE